MGGQPGALPGQSLPGQQPGMLPPPGDASLMQHADAKDPEEGAQLTYEHAFKVGNVGGRALTATMFLCEIGHIHTHARARRHTCTSRCAHCRYSMMTRGWTRWCTCSLRKILSGWHSHCPRGRLPSLPRGSPRWGNEQGACTPLATAHTGCSLFALVLASTLSCVQRRRLSRCLARSARPMQQRSDMDTYCKRTGGGWPVHREATRPGPELLVQDGAAHFKGGRSLAQR